MIFEDNDNLCNFLQKMVKIFLVGLLLGFSIASTRADCPDGFLRHHSSCYHFSHDTENWFDAAGICIKLYGGNLVEINDDNENDFLVREANVRRIEYWIGANDLQVEGEWKWLTSNMMVTSAKWGGGGPSNQGNDENCAEIMNGVWNDDSCHKAQHYICEIDTALNEIVGKRRITKQRIVK